MRGEVPPSSLHLVESGARGAADQDFYLLKLYVAGETPKSLAAISNLRQLCATHLADRYEIEIIDLALNPELAARDQILALPTLIRRLPAPLKRIIGTLSDTEKVLVGLELRGPIDE